MEWTPEEEEEEEVDYRRKGLVFGGGGETGWECLLSIPTTRIADTPFCWKSLEGISECKLQVFIIIINLPGQGNLEAQTKKKMRKSRRGQTCAVKCKQAAA